ncbi:MAG TPA: AmmeMemoRadiSam system protein B [Pontiella sp.]
MEEKILHSELAGTWYPADPERLAGELDSYIDAADPEPVERVMALILPHAGYQYSGQVAAYGVKLLKGRSFSRVVVLGPSHRVVMHNSISIPNVTHLETPLGKIEIDQGTAVRLRGYEGVLSNPHAHVDEHSVQIELPFLQLVLGKFKLVPIVCGDLDLAGAKRIAQMLLENIDSDTLMVISSDFTHYGRNFGYVPFTADIEKNLRALDLGAFEQIRQKKLNGFLEYVENTGATICGRSPIAVLLAMLPAESQVHLLKYDNSGVMTADWSHCVSYISVAVSGMWPDNSTLNSHEKHLFSSKDKATLLQLARHRIRAKLNPSEPDFDFELTASMQKVMGAFVTLHKYGQLRGCIGEIFPRRSICEAVAEQAVNSAFHDPRFPKLRADELEDVDIEISALTAPHPVSSPDEIEIGRHGIVLYKGIHSAVFLPQVALEQGWDLETTLSHLSMKAGMGPRDWESGCDFHVFEAIVFGEV